MTPSERDRERAREIVRIARSSPMNPWDAVQGGIATALDEAREEGRRKGYDDGYAKAHKEWQHARP